MADKSASDTKPTESKMMAAAVPAETAAVVPSEAAAVVHPEAAAVPSKSPVASSDATDSKTVEPAASQKRKVALFLAYVGSEYQASPLRLKWQCSANYK